MEKNKYWIMEENKEVKICNNIYKTIKPLGAGGNGYVWKVERDGKEYAIKVLKLKKKDKKGKKRFYREIKFCENNKHNNLIYIYEHGYLEDKGEKYPCYIMPVYNSSLCSYIEEVKTTENIEIISKSIDYIIQICEGIKFLHEKGVIHRDLKPENILIKDNNLVLSDLGIAHFEEGFDNITKPGDLLMNRAYAAPEQKVKGNSNNITSAVDIFALGTIINEIFTGKRADGEYYGLISDKYPWLRDIDKLVSECRRENPFERPDINTVLYRIKEVMYINNDDIEIITKSLEKKFNIYMNDMKSTVAEILELTTADEKNYELIAKRYNWSKDNYRLDNAIDIIDDILTLEEDKLNDEESNEYFPEGISDKDEWLLVLKNINNMARSYITGMYTDTDRRTLLSKIKKDINETNIMKIRSVLEDALNAYMCEKGKNIISQAKYDILVAEYLYKETYENIKNKYNKYYPDNIYYDVGDDFKSDYIVYLVYKGCLERFMELKKNIQPEILDFEKNEEHKELYNRIKTFLVKYSVRDELAEKILNMCTFLGPYKCKKMIEGDSGLKYIESNCSILCYVPLIGKIIVLKGQKYTEDIDLKNEIGIKNDIDFKNDIDINWYKTLVNYGTEDESEDKTYKNLISMPVNTYEIEKTMKKFKEIFPRAVVEKNKDRGEDYDELRFIVRFGDEESYDKFKSFIFKIKNTEYPFKEDVCDLTETMFKYKDLITLKKKWSFWDVYRIEETMFIVQSLMIKNKIGKTYTNSIIEDDIKTFEKMKGIDLQIEIERDANERYEELLKIPNKWNYFSEEYGQLYDEKGVKIEWKSEPCISDVKKIDNEWCYVSIGRLDNGDSILCERKSGRILIYDKENNKIKKDVSYPDFMTFLWRTCTMVC
jgi:serine/threonine protein kinase with beta-lactam domains